MYYFILSALYFEFFLCCFVLLYNSLKNNDRISYYFNLYFSNFDDIQLENVKNLSFMSEKSCIFVSSNSAVSIWKHENDFNISSRHETETFLHHDRKNQPDYAGQKYYAPPVRLRARHPAQQPLPHHEWSQQAQSRLYHEDHAAVARHQYQLAYVRHRRHAGRPGHPLGTRGRRAAGG